jgi:hypothetical protein
MDSFFPSGKVLGLPRMLRHMIEQHDIFVNDADGAP